MAIWDQEIWPAVLDFVDQTGHPGPNFLRMVATRAVAAGIQWLASVGTRPRRLRELDRQAAADGGRMGEGRQLASGGLPRGSRSSSVAIRGAKRWIGSLGRICGARDPAAP